MSKLMLIAGILLVAVAIASGLMIFFSPSSVIGWGITPEVAAVLLVGGILSLGLGAVISALEAGIPLHGTATENSATAAPASQTETAIPEFGRRPMEAAAATATAVAHEVSPAVYDTIKALEQAKSDISKAFGHEPQAPAEIAEEVAAAEEQVAEVQAEEPVAEVEIAESEVAVEEEGQLYVVEERIIRARPARILSDGTVEAETDEGWMRFENLEHLDEYLDAMAPAERG